MSSRICAEVVFAQRYGISRRDLWLRLWGEEGGVGRRYSCFGFGVGVLRGDFEAAGIFQGCENVSF